MTPSVRYWTFDEWLTDLADLLKCPVNNLQKHHAKVKPLYQKGFTPLAARAKLQNTLDQQRPGVYRPIASSRPTEPRAAT